MNRNLQTTIKASIVLAAIAAFSGARASEILNFDNLNGSGFFTTPYDGFSFGNNNLATNQWYWSDQSSPPYTAHSGSTTVSTDYTQFNGGDLDPAMPITNSNPFVFSGAWFSGPGLNPDDTAERVVYELFNGNTLVFTSAASSVLSATPTFYASGYNGPVTGVVIEGPQGYFAMDDFTLQVPEPATMSLMFAGLGLMTVAQLRKRKSLG